MGGDARRPIANQGRRCARTTATPLGGRRGGCEHVVHRERVGDGGSTRAAPQRTDQRVVGCLGVRAQGGGPVSVRDAARHDATSCGAALWLKQFQVPYFELNFLKFSKQNCTKV
jgi:hypothetical protein